MGELFPPIKAYHAGRLKVSSLHTIYFEEYGNPKGKPLIFLHGGPGASFTPAHCRYFNPKKWRVVIFDQRGCGKSRPYGELRENTTWDLVADIEKLREHLGIDKWVVFGGSWGSTLALAYSQKHPERCKGLILRGIFLVRPLEFKWFYQEGANYVFPDAYERFVKPIPVSERGDLLAAYYKRLTHPDRRARLPAAKAWAIWEGETIQLQPDKKVITDSGKNHYAEAIARIETHYFVNKGFLRSETQLLDDVKKIRSIPAVIVHGRYDMICPMTSAWDLHRAWPEAKLVIVPDAGHTMREPGIRDVLIAETDKMAVL